MGDENTKEPLDQSREAFATGEKDKAMATPQTWFYSPSYTVCPHCGYCPHCGRSGHRFHPYYEPFYGIRTAGTEGNGGSYGPFM